MKTNLHEWFKQQMNTDIHRFFVEQRNTRNATETPVANAECSVLNDELKENSYFITHTSSFAESDYSALITYHSSFAAGVMAEKLKEIQR